MSTHYLIEANASVLANSRILGAMPVVPGVPTPAVGAFIVRVPDGVQVDTPTGLLDLLTKKYAGLLAYYVGFGNIVYDPLLDAMGIDTVNSGGCLLGDRSTIQLLNVSSGVRSVVRPLGSTPAMAVVTWEGFSYNYSDDKASLLNRTYTERADVGMDVSFNNGATWISVTDGLPFNIPVADQGNQLIVGLNNSIAWVRRYVGSWAVIY